MNENMGSGWVLDDRTKTVIVSLYKSKGGKSKYKNYREVSLLCIVSKVYGRTVIGCVKRISEAPVGEEKGGFRKARGCVDQIFAHIQAVGKALEKKKGVYNIYGF